jgi:hypothetical protein
MATFSGLCQKSRRNHRDNNEDATHDPEQIARSLLPGVCRRTAKRDSGRPRKQSSAWLSVTPS